MSMSSACSCTGLAAMVPSTADWLVVSALLAASERADDGFGSNEAYTYITTVSARRYSNWQV